MGTSHHRCFIRFITPPEGSTLISGIPNTPSFQTAKVTYITLDAHLLAYSLLETLIRSYITLHLSKQQHKEALHTWLVTSLDQYWYQYLGFGPSTHHCLFQYFSLAVITQKSNFSCTNIRTFCCNTPHRIKPLSRLPLPSQTRPYNPKQ